MKESYYFNDSFLWPESASSIPVAKKKEPKNGHVTFGDLLNKSSELTNEGLCICIKDVDIHNASIKPSAKGSGLFSQRT